MPTDLLIVIIFEFAISILGMLLVSLPLAKKYKERRSAVTLLVSLAVVSNLIAAFLSAIGRILRYTGAWEIQPNVRLEMIAFTVAGIALGDAFFFTFTLEVFRGGLAQSNNKKIALIFAVAVVGFIIYDIATGLFLVDLTMAIWSILIGLTCVAYLFLAQSAWAASRKFEGRLDKLCTKLIAFGSLLMVVSFVFFAIESFLTYAMGGVTQFSVYYFIAWSLVVLAIFVLSTGYIQPEWLKRRISEK